MENIEELKKKFIVSEEFGELKLQMNELEKKIDNFKNRLEFIEREEDKKKKIKNDINSVEDKFEQKEFVENFTNVVDKLKLMTSKLTGRAVITLLASETGLGKGDTRRVVEAIENADRVFLRKEEI